MQYANSSESVPESNHRNAVIKFAIFPLVFGVYLFKNLRPKFFGKLILCNLYKSNVFHRVLSVSVRVSKNCFVTPNGERMVEQQSASNSTYL